MFDEVRMPACDFEREERYIVVKLKRMTDEKEQALRDFLRSEDIPTEECVVVEHDWPNYEHVWKTIEAVESGTWTEYDETADGK